MTACCCSIFDIREERNVGIGQWTSKKLILLKQASVICVEPVGLNLVANCENNAFQKSQCMKWQTDFWNCFLRWSTQMHLRKLSVDVVISTAIQRSFILQWFDVVQFLLRISVSQLCHVVERQSLYAHIVKANKFLYWIWVVFCLEKQRARSKKKIFISLSSSSVRSYFP